MKDIKKLRAYVKGRKLPKYKFLGKANSKWLNDMKTLNNSISDTDDPGIYRKEIEGLEISNYDELLTYYSQKQNLNVKLDFILQQFEGISHQRFAILKKYETLPMHLDNPDTLRLVSIIHGTQTLLFEDKDAIDMSTGDIYFLNGCYKHSVINKINIDRVTFLCNCSNNEYNKTRLLRAGAGRKHF